MSKFEFGDKVLCHWDNKTFEAVVIAHWVDSDTQGQESNWVEVVDENGDKTDVGIDCVAHVLHPDTVRLDWLEKQMIEDSPEVIISDGYGRFFAMKDFTAAHIPTFETIREAIDSTISEEQADD